MKFQIFSRIFTRRPSSLLTRVLFSCALFGGIIEQVIPAPLLYAESPPPPGGSKAALDLGFLDLPAFDITQVSPEGNSVKVGDILQMKLNALKIPGIEHPSTDLTLAEPPAETTLHEQGWDIQLLPPKKTQPKQKPKPQTETETATETETPTETETDLTFLAIPLKPGELTLPSLALRDAQGKNLGRTNPLTYRVSSAIQPNDPKPEEPESLEPPVGLAFPVWIIFVALIIAVLVVGAVTFIFLRWRKNHRNKTWQPPEMIRTEDEAALQSLFELEQKHYVQTGQFKIYYFTMSEILKTYLGRRFRFDAAESTTREVLNYLEKNQTTSDPLLDRLEALFNQLDRVKFTDFVPGVPESLALMVEVREWIQLTRQVPTILGQSGVSQNASQ